MSWKIDRFWRNMVLISIVDFLNMCVGIFIREIEVLRIIFEVFVI